MRIAVIANVPVWTLPGLEHLRHNRHYATWLEPLIPAFEQYSGEFDIHWITMCKETKIALEHHAFGQTFHILPRWKLSVSILTGYLAEITCVHRILTKIRPDVLHAWGSEDVCGLAGVFSGVTNRIFTLQGGLTEYVRLLGGPPLFRLQSLYERPVVKRYDYGTAESPGAAALLHELNPHMEIKLVDYGVNLEFFASKWRPAVSPEVVFVGGITARKGIADLVTVAKKPELAHIKFRLIGDGPLRVAFEAEGLPNVEWLGSCNRQAVIEHLSRAWALVMPTLADTGPTVVKEARVIGLPIVTTTSAGASSYVSDSGCGMVITPSDKDALAAAILKICESRETCLIYGGAHWEKHRKVLHPNATAANFVEIYKKIF